MGIKPAEVTVAAGIGARIEDADGRTYLWWQDTPGARQFIRDFDGRVDERLHPTSFVLKPGEDPTYVYGYE